MGREGKRLLVNANGISSSRLLFVALGLIGIFSFRLLYMVDQEDDNELYSKKDPNLQKNRLFSPTSSPLGGLHDKDWSEGRGQYDRNKGWVQSSRDSSASGVSNVRDSSSRSSNSNNSSSIGFHGDNDLFIEKLHYHGEHFILSLSDNEFRTLTFDKLMAPYGEADGGFSCPNDFGNQLVNRWRNTKKTYCERLYTNTNSLLYVDTKFKSHHSAVSFRLFQPLHCVQKWRNNWTFLYN